MRTYTINVSIHTPPWGRDSRTDYKVNGCRVSIHTPPWGRDYAYSLYRFTIRFQFTRPRGGAIRRSSPSFHSGCFNSHAPVGARSQSAFHLRGKVVSIHTPPWGRDQGEQGVHLRQEVSIHTPPWGRDDGADESTTVSKFQFTRPRGGAMHSPRADSSATSFNSHAPVGAR